MSSQQKKHLERNEDEEEELKIGKKIFNTLEGSWTIQRDIPHVGKMTNGQATFINNNNPYELVYTERGYFSFNSQDSSSLSSSPETTSQPIQATKSFLYRYDEFTDSIKVFFLRNNNNKKNHQEEENDNLFHCISIVEDKHDPIADPRKRRKSDAEKTVYGSHSLTNKPVKYVVNKEEHQQMQISYYFNIVKDEFTIVYDVSGPRENYVSRTNFKRNEDSINTNNTNTNTNTNNNKT